MFRIINCGMPLLAISTLVCGGYSSCHRQNRLGWPIKKTTTLPLRKNYISSQQQQISNLNLYLLQSRIRTIYPQTTAGATIRRVLHARGDLPCKRCRSGTCDAPLPCVMCQLARLHQECDYFVTFAITIAHLATVDVTDETFIKTNKSVLSLLRRLSTRRCPHLLLNAGACHTAPAARQQLSIDISCTQGAQQQTRLPPLLSIDETHGRTDTRSIHTPCSAYDA